MICIPPGQPMPTRQNPDDLAPAPSFLSRGHDHPRAKEQHGRLTELAPDLRRLGVLIDHNEVEAAFAVVGAMICKRQRSGVRIAETHLKDAGLSHKLVTDLSQHNIHTVKDLACCNPLKMARQMDLLDILRAVQVALRRVVELELAG